MRSIPFALVAGAVAVLSIASLAEALAQQPRRRGAVEFTVRRPPDNNLPGVRRFGDGSPPQAVASPGHYFRTDLEPFWWNPGPPRQADPRGFIDGWHGVISPGFPIPTP